MMESGARDSHYNSQLMHVQPVSTASTPSIVKDPLAIQMNLKDVKIRPSSTSTLKAAGDEEIYAVSPRAPLLTTDLQNNAYVVGEARFGQLGSGVRPPSHHKLVPSPQPTSVAGDNSWAVISLGTYHAAAITSQGRLFCWGLNSKGQCGIAEPDPADKGRITYYPGPARVKSSTTGSTFKAVACGEEHTIALGSRGLCAWGNNSRGQLGLGPGSPAVVWRPMLVSSLGRTSITQLVCGGQFTLALTAQSQVLAWGANDCGQLGQGDVLDRHTPTQVDGLWGLPITRLAVGDAHALALTTTGQLYSWGKNAHGQCGVVVEAEDQAAAAATMFASAAPAQQTAAPPAEAAPSPPPAPVAAASTSLFEQDYRNGPIPLPAALRPQGDPAVLEQWRLSMLTMGIEAEQADMALHVTGWRGIEIALEWLFSQNEHEVRRQMDRWRALLRHHAAAEAAAAQQQASPQQQTQQQLTRSSASNIPNGDHSSSSRSPSGSNQRVVEGAVPPHNAASHQKSRFSRVKQDEDAPAAGNTLANGPGSSGRLTDEPAILVPTQVALQCVRHVAAGTAFSVAVLEQGDVYSWGQGKWGALGHGDDTDRPLPTWVEALENVVGERVSCGQYHTCIITREGAVYGCGRCEAGQLGHVPAPRNDSVAVDNVSVMSTPVVLQLTHALIEQLSASQCSPLHQGSPNGAASAYSDGMSDSDGPNSRDMGGTPMSVDRHPTSPTSTINYPALTRSPNTPDVVVHEVVAGGCNTAILLRKQQEAPSPWQVTLLAKLQANVARALLLQNNGQGPTPQLAAALRNVAKGAQLVLSSPAALCAALAVRPKASNLARTISSHDSHVHSMTSGRRHRGRDGLQSHKSHGLASKISYTTTSTNMVPAPLALPLDIPLYDQMYCSLLELSGIHKDPATTGSLSTNFDDQGPAMCELQRYALQQTLMRCGLTLCEDLMGHSAMLKTPERAQVLLAAMHCPLLSDANNAKQLLPKLCHAVMAAPAAARRLLVRWWASYPAELMQERLVQPMQAYITKELAAMKKLTSSIMAVIKVLARVESASQLAGGLLPPEAFYNTLISEKMDVQDHYSAWRTTQDLGGGLPGARPVTNTSGIQLYANEPDSDPESPRRLRRLRHAAASKAQAAAAAAQQMAASRAQMDNVVNAQARSDSPRPDSSHSDGAAGGGGGGGGGSSHAANVTGMHPALAEVVHGASQDDSRSETPERQGRSSDQGSGGELADHDVGDMPTGMRMSDPGRRTQGGAPGLPPLVIPGSAGSGTTHPQRRNTLTGSTSELVSRRSTQPPPDLRMDPDPLHSSLYGQPQRASASGAAATRGVDDQALPSPTPAWASNAAQQSTHALQLTLPPLPSPPGMNSAQASQPGGGARTSRSGLPPRSATPPPAGSADQSGRRSLTGSGSRNPYTDMDEPLPPHPGLARAHRMSDSGVAGPVPGNAHGVAGSPSTMPGTPATDGPSSRRASASGAASSSQPQHHSTPLPLLDPASHGHVSNTNPSSSSSAAERAASTPATTGGSSTAAANPAAPAAARSTEPGPFSFCTYPFLLDARAKSNLLHIEARFQMEQTVAHARMEQQLYGQHSRFGRSENGAAGSGRQRHSENGSVNGGRTSPSTEEDLMIHVLEKVHAAEEGDEDWPVGSSGSANRSSSTPGHAVEARHGQRRAKGFRGLLAALLRPTGRSSPGYEEEAPPAVDRSESFRLPRPRDCTMPATHSDMCMVRARRTHLVEDALDEITRQARRDLYKPLRVHFIGEDGIDAGGVKKEFFALLLAELLKPEFGLMEVQPESNTYWFPRNSSCAPFQYQLLGLVLGLAVYNRVLLDFQLPLAAYKKMLGLPVTLRDLGEMIPSVGKSLKSLLEFEGPPGTIEDVLCLTWVVEEEVWGQRREVELVPGGRDLPVTEDNREAYVEALLDYYLNKSVRWQFEGFARGFGVLINGPALRLFNAQELERLVCGNPTLDWGALQRNAKYEGGYNANSPVVTWLWDIVRNELPLDEKKRFLKFFTGSDRAPIGGLGTLRCIIQRAGPDSDRLPTSHTCFNTLLLPEYLQRTKLARLLRTAINNAEGFGME